MKAPVNSNATEVFLQESTTNAFVRSTRALKMSALTELHLGREHGEQHQHIRIPIYGQMLSALTTTVIAHFKNENERI